MNREVKQFLEWAQSRGWSYQFTRGGHIKLQKRGCITVFAPATPSDRRSIKNVKSKIERAERAAGQS